MVPLSAKQTAPYVAFCGCAVPITSEGNYCCGQSGRVKRVFWRNGQFGDALARCSPTRRGGRIAGALFSWASIEAGCGAEKAACPPSAQGTDGTGLPNQSL